MNEQPKKTVAVNNPGGQPRQIRVQYRDGENSIWMHSAVCRKLEAAEERAAELRSRGLTVRLVHYRLPTAA